MPIIVVRRDADLTAIWNEEKAEWIIYVTDVSQQQYFDMVAKCYDNPNVNHVGFGLLLGEDENRSRELIRVDLLGSDVGGAGGDVDWKEEWNLNTEQCAVQWTEEWAVKYVNLKSNYTFNDLFSDEIITPWCLHAYDTIWSIITNSGKDMEELKKTGSLVLDHAYDRELGLLLLQFSKVVKNACILPNQLCDYLHNLSEGVMEVYNKCQVDVGSAEETSRLLLYDATAVVMRRCFLLLGIEPLAYTLI